MIYFYNEAWSLIIEVISIIDLSRIDLDAEYINGCTAFQLLVSKAVELYVAYYYFDGWNLHNAVSRIEICIDLTEISRQDLYENAEKQLASTRRFASWTRPLNLKEEFKVDPKMCEEALLNFKAFASLLHRIQESKGVPVEARYPQLITSINYIDQLWDKKNDECDGSCHLPGAWLE
ncbi:hypothetical protein MMC28_005630 [Mycoblastus sanguinarius]|nr:hypothetical protein [Mycoblastus sanguinarius]